MLTRTQMLQDHGRELMPIRFSAADDAAPDENDLDAAAMQQKKTMSEVERADCENERLVERYDAVVASNKKKIANDCRQDRSVTTRSQKIARQDNVRKRRHTQIRRLAKDKKVYRRERVTLSTDVGEGGMGGCSVNVDTVDTDDTMTPADKIVAI
ncbi:Uncharacterized protein FWK35_00023662 [Aphis craccivora]|uniref:Uncharacterized protein n=1 Tax=Aphis craccivora TaxID=307492 RepID=A0A6G0Z4Z2_APHCR|nr:Uncharacterized protein FWK35_00023662 [Aphis craccivora]